ARSAACGSRSSSTSSRSCSWSSTSRWCSCIPGRSSSVASAGWGSGRWPPSWRCSASGSPTSGASALWNGTEGVARASSPTGERSAAGSSMELLIAFGKALVALFIILQVTVLLLWIERKGSALIQDRVGANRANIFGGLLPFNLGIVNTLMADPLKLFHKEDIVPKDADRFRSEERRVEKQIKLIKQRHCET